MPRFHLPRVLSLLAALLGFLSPRLSAQIGGLDPGFAPAAILNGASAGTVRAVYWQSNGQVIIAGEFTTIGGTSRGRIARLNADGTLDTAFAPNAGADGIIHTLAVQSDGKIIIGGEFTNVDGTARNRIARLTSTGTLDATFNPGTGCNGPVYATLISGTSVFIGGDFTTVNGTTRNRIAKLTSTGALDGSWVPSGGANLAVYCLASDVTFSGSYILAGGAFTTFNGSARNRLARVTVSSGTLDSQFNATGGLSSTVYAMACVSDGVSQASLYVGGDFTSVSSISRGRIARYSASGLSWALDAAFNFYLDNTCRSLTVTGNASNSSLRLYAGGAFTSVNGQAHGGVTRLKYTNVSNTYYWDVDSTYSTAGGANGTIYGIQTTTDGKAYIGGAFTTVDGTATQTAARLYSDTGSQPPATPTGLAATSLSSSQVYVQWSTSTGASSYSLERSPDGSTGWAVLSSTGSTAFYDTGLAPGSTSFYRVKAINSNGSSAYAANVSATTSATAWTGSGLLATNPGAGMTNGTVSDILVQADGKILIAGNFSTVLGQPRANVARLLADYTLDTTFDPGAGPNSSITKMALMPDGRIYLFGNFSTVAGVTENYLARLNASGSLDTSFNSGTGSVFIDSIVMQDDGRLLVYGKFSGSSSGGFSGSGKGYLVRLNLDGSVDNSFDPQPNNWVDTASVQPDGRIVIAGVFSSVHGVSRSYLARLNTDGTLDTGFAPTGYFSSSQGVKALKNGNILLFGPLTSINGVARQYLAVLNGDGTLNTNFVTSAATAPNVAPSDVSPQPDGKFIIIGTFTNVGGTTAWKIARLNADGSLDTTFNAEAGPVGGSVSVAIPLRDSSILVGGSFSQFGAAAQNNLARLNGDAIVSAPAAPSSASATTVSSGSITIAWSSAIGGFSYKIERSLDGVSGWVQVAEMPWSFNSYTNSGLTAGTTFYYRVRASNSAGDSAYATTAATPTYTGYQQWKLNYGFSLTEPDTSDSDGDGIPLILEYALGTNPLTVDQNALPVGQTLNGTVALSYRKYRSDVTYTVEASTDLVNWSSNGVNQGSGPFPIAWVLIGTDPQKYLRLKVTVP